MYSHNPVFCFPTVYMSVSVSATRYFDDCSSAIYLEIWVVIPHAASFCSGSLSGVFGIVIRILGDFLKSVWRMSWALGFGLHWICKLLLAGCSFSQYWFYQPANMGGRSFHLLVPSSFNVFTAEVFSLQDRFNPEFCLALSLWWGCCEGECFPDLLRVFVASIRERRLIFVPCYFAETVNHFSKCPGVIFGISGV